jgi:hypothetical protein
MPRNAAGAKPVAIPTPGLAVPFPAHPHHIGSIPTRDRRGKHGDREPAALFRLRPEIYSGFREVLAVVANQ